MDSYVNVTVIVIILMFSYIKSVQKVETIGFNMQCNLFIIIFHAFNIQTGTLTEDGLDLHGIVPLQDHK